ncbi:extracellular solute-binding protein [Cellulomonas cellasea]|uniref:ABC transporter substrate-binding protein n=2 Tax=Cellulomonas cellasea TaxID=43670 RepID=A0A0A0BCL4_9CELL|nr:extracellular solute-binding protein [Cellulomonas cellasea]KGM03832.1 ABC transporter substrate-binding protein [Cellulomonas cellasea DSM 20118]GEA87243.1 carbohydrate-binding protein [Cellulomonas cellasea]
MMTEHVLSRRAFLRAAVAAGGITALAGCGSPSGGGGAVPLAYWNFFVGGDGERMVGLVDTFRDEAPRTDVTATTLAWGAPYYTKLAMACAGGRAPDLATLHASRLATFGKELVDEWDLAELEARGVTPDQFPAPVLERVTIDGRLMALPLDTHPLVLFYNTEVCAQAGLLAADGTLAPIQGAEAFLDAGRRAAAVTGANGIAFGAADALATWMVFWSLFRQLGGRIELPEGGPAEVDRDAMVEAMAFLQTMCDGTIASKTLDGPAAPASFASGQAGFLLIGPWEIVTAQNAGTPFSMTQFPAIFGDVPYVRADSHSLVLPRQAKVDPAARSAAYDMAVSMLTNSLDWARGGHIPALSSVAESPEYLALQPQSAYREAAQVVEFDPDAYFSGSGSTLMSRAGQTLQGITSGALTPDEGADDLIGWLDQQLTLGSPV